MLDAGGAVVVEVLLDLALAPAGGGLVDRQDDSHAVPHHRRHERRVLRRDGGVVEVDELVEAEDPLVERNPPCERPQLDVGHHVVDRTDAHGRAARRGQRGRPVAGEEGARVAVPVDEGVHGVAVGGDAGGDDLAVVVVGQPRRHEPGRTPRERRLVRVPGVSHAEGDVVDAVPVRPHVGRDRGHGIEGARDHEADVSLGQDVGRPVSPTRLRPRVGRGLEPEAGGHEGRERAWVAHPPLQVVDALEQGSGGGTRGQGVGERGHDRTPSRAPRRSPSRPAQKTATPSSISAAPPRKRSSSKPGSAQASSMFTLYSEDVI